MSTYHEPSIGEEIYNMYLTNRTTWQGIADAFGIRRGSAYEAARAYALQNRLEWPLCHKSDHNHNRSGTKGEQAYRLRQSGLPWKEVARRIGYSSKRADMCAVNAARRYAGARSAKWPVPIDPTDSTGGAA